MRVKKNPMWTHSSFQELYVETDLSRRRNIGTPETERIEKWQRGMSGRRSSLRSIVAAKAAECNPFWSRPNQNHKQEPQKPSQTPGHNAGIRQETGRTKKEDLSKASPSEG